MITVLVCVTVSAAVSLAVSDYICRRYYLGLNKSWEKTFQEMKKDYA